MLLPDPPVHRRSHHRRHSAKSGRWSQDLPFHETCFRPRCGQSPQGHPKAPEHPPLTGRASQGLIASRPDPVGAEPSDMPSLHDDKSNERAGGPRTIRPQSRSFVLGCSFQRSRSPRSEALLPKPHCLSRAGGARRDRTDDLMLAKHALSQLSYGPDHKRSPARREIDQPRNPTRRGGPPGPRSPGKAEAEAAEETKLEDRRRSAANWWA